MSIELSLVQKIVIWILPLLLAITVHEVAHGYVADKLGDQTAKILGRLTLNPLKHIDPIGTIFIPIALLIAGGFIFGWARPVPINPRNLKHPRRDLALVAAAGPLSNLIMAILWALIMKLGLIIVQQGGQYFYPIILMGQAGISINLILMLLNLIPIPPLDGSKIIAPLLPRRALYYYERIEPYGFFILMILIILGVLSFILMPLLSILQHLFALIFHLY